MGWGLGHDSNWGRDIGYSVPAFCDHPGCWKEIDRGLAHVCSNQEPRGGDDCGLYFCGDHQSGCGRCERCQHDKEPFQGKPEHPTWLYWKLHHHSWEQWRQECPDEFAEASSAWVAWGEAAPQCLRIHYYLMQKVAPHSFWNDKELREVSKVLCLQASEIRQWLRQAKKDYEDEVAHESA